MGSLEKHFENLEIKNSEALLYVNGKRHVLPDGYAHYTLLEYLRGLGLTGTKLGCGEGGCGACTVMVSHYDTGECKIVHRAVNACLAPLYAVEGMHVMTVEGIGSKRRGLHKVQALLANSHGSQCGFCTPGFVMSMYSLLRSSKAPPTQEQIEESLAGNLCRCTGYRAIVDAFRTFTKMDAFLYWDDNSKAAGNTATRDGNTTICPSTGKPCDCGNNSVNSCSSGHEEQHSMLKERELIFPPELMNRKAHPLALKGAAGLRWYRPLKLDDLLELRNRYPESKLVVGNSELGIETRFKNLKYPVLIAVTHIPELNSLTVQEDGIHIGASVTLERLYHVLRDCIKNRKIYETSTCSAIIGQLKWFAGAQIRNVASVGGNICTASPISDLNPLWIASGAVFTAIDSNGVSRTIQAKDFFVGYRRIALKKGEILSNVHLPWTRKHEFVKEYKQSHRRDDDIALVNAGMRVHLEKAATSWIVSDVCLVYGGVAAVPLSASKTEAFLKGKAWDKDTLEKTLLVLQQDIVISANAPGGMPEFRQSLISSFFFKFFLSVTYQLEKDEKLVHCFPESFRSAAEPYKRDDSHGRQNYQTLLNGAVVGQPLVHASAELQVSGEAEYVDDIPLPSNGYHAALVLSTKPHARIISIDPQEAQAIEGFVGFFSAKDIPGENDVGAIVHDEEVFATEYVTCVGHVIGIVVAETLHAARASALKIKITYEELPAILSIEEAVAAGSFIPNTKRVLQRGDVESSFQVCDHIVEGTVQMGGQEHFYLEPNGALVWTLDGGNEVSMICSTQTPQKHQKTIAHVLGLPMHKVICKTKRIGGGFGGKETRPAFLAAAASVPAYLLRRPIKLILDREVDMAVTGQRHPFLGKYKVGFTNEGKIMALQLEIYNNGGNSLDLSGSVLERAIFHSDSVYEIPNVHITGQVCFTNLPSNTAFRGFGGPQGLLVAETWIEHMAYVLKMPATEIRELNMQSENSELPYGQVLEHCRIQAVWDELKSSSACVDRQSEVDKFNGLNRWRKRGISLIPTKFGISFTAKFLNQAGSLVQVYTDGTVLVTHGGVEMGQGLHTKVAQIAADAFGIPISSVFISETSTDKVPNASATAASASSDMYGAATLDACLQIKGRMQPVASTGAYSSFSELVMACYLQRIDLSAHGFYKTPDIGFDWDVGKGKPFSYFTYGAACAEVEVDCLTGDFHTRRVDIVMDLGHSLNPAIDIGQIEGAFMQGLGWVALEELKWGDKAHPWVRPGHLFTQGPGNYKIPTINDVPLDFRVSLLKDAPNPRAIHSSKAVGEPPFFLGASAFFAVKQAVARAREEHGYGEWFNLDTPATPERIRTACTDEITSHFEGRPKLSV